MAPDRGHRTDRGDNCVLRRYQVWKHHHNFVEDTWAVPHLDDSGCCHYHHDKRLIDYHYNNGPAHAVSI